MNIICDIKSKEIKGDWSFRCILNDVGKTHNTVLHKKQDIKQ